MVPHPKPMAGPAHSGCRLAFLQGIGFQLFPNAFIQGYSVFMCFQWSLTRDPLRSKYEATLNIASPLATGCWGGRKPDPFSSRRAPGCGNHSDLAGYLQGICYLFSLGLAAPGSCHHQLHFLSALSYNKHWSRGLELVTSEALPVSSFCLIVSVLFSRAFSTLFCASWFALCLFTLLQQRGLGYIP